MMPGRSPDLRSDRLLLRAPHLNDAEVMCKLADDNEVARWMGRIPHPYRLADALFFLNDIVPHEVAWMIEVTDQGVAGVGGFAFPANGQDVELGYWLGQPFWGKGYATEAATLMLGYAWASGTSSVRSGCFDGNERSRRVLDKVGFQVVGRSTRSNLAQGLDLRHVDMSINRPDP